MLKDFNTRAVFEHLAQGGAQSRTEIAKSLELSLASVSRIVESLMTARLLLEGSHVASKVGRRQVLVDINPQAALVAGVSIRSRYMRVYITDLKGNKQYQTRVERVQSTTDALVQQVVHEVSDFVSSQPTRLGGLAVGISGAWHPSEQRVYAAPNVDVLEGINLQALLCEAFGEWLAEDAIAVDNDVNFAALGELRYGAAKGSQNFFYFNLGSGVGGVPVINGQVQPGAQGFAGEIGYLPICVGDEVHMLEQLIGRSALEKRAKAIGLTTTDDLLHAAYNQQDPEAQKYVKQLCQYLAIAIASITTNFNPELIVLGGSIGKYSDRLLPDIEQRLTIWLPLQPTLVSTNLGRDANLIGAAVHARQLARSLLIDRKMAA
ncbi:MAG: ROK family protein [Deinococcota bacterium]